MANYIPNLLTNVVLSRLVYRFIFCVGLMGNVIETVGVAILVVEVNVEAITTINMELVFVETVKELLIADNPR